MGKFEIINGTADTQDEVLVAECFRKAFCWQRQSQTATEEALEKYGTFLEMPQDTLAKIVFSNVKYILAMEDYLNAKLEQNTVQFAKVWFGLLDILFTLMGRMKLKNFVTTFPVTKDYDGETWRCKDYFTTMELLKQYDMDKPIGEDKMFTFLYDYQNEYLHRIMILKMCCTSKLYKMETGRNMAVEFMEDLVDSHHSANYEKGYQINSMTGEIKKIPKKYKFEPIT